MPIQTIAILFVSLLAAAQCGMIQQFIIKLAYVSMNGYDFIFTKVIEWPRIRMMTCSIIVMVNQFNPGDFPSHLVIDRPQILTQSILCEVTAMRKFRSLSCEDVIDAFRHSRDFLKWIAFNVTSKWKKSDIHIFYCVIFNVMRATEVDPSACAPECYFYLIPNRL